MCFFAMEKTSMMDIVCRFQQRKKCWMLLPVALFDFVHVGMDLSILNYFLEVQSDDYLFPIFDID